MFDGPMWKIAYDFKAAGTNADGSAVVYGQLWREKNWAGTVASTLSINAKTSQGDNSMTETRGDGPSRTFTYNTYLLKTVTDFNGAVASQSYGNDYWLDSVTDRNGNQTTFTCGHVTGIVAQVSYQIPGDVYPSGTRTVLSYTYRSEERRVGKECRSRWSPDH